MKCKIEIIRNVLRNQMSRFDVTIIRVLEEKTNDMHLLYLPLFISTCWLLHVSAVACHHQGAY
jgi:hypothetical protein